MISFNKAAKILTKKEPQLTGRLFNGGWNNIGIVKREPDNRTKEQLLENIDYYANQCPEVAQFKNELKSMNPKHLGLVSDICELANHLEHLNTAINIKKPDANGKSLFQFLMEILPKASKENPESLELSQSIIDNTDSIGAKYALNALRNLYDCKDAARHIKATIPFVRDIADAAFEGGYTMDYSKEKTFVNGLNSFISPNVSLEKLEFFPEIIKTAEEADATCVIDAFPFLTNKASVSKIKENLETFKNLASGIKDKKINLTDFLDNNVNIK